MLTRAIVGLLSNLFSNRTPVATATHSPLSSSHRYNYSAELESRHLQASDRQPLSERVGAFDQLDLGSRECNGLASYPGNQYARGMSWQHKRKRL